AREENGVEYRDYDDLGRATIELLKEADETGTIVYKLEYHGTGQVIAVKTGYSSYRISEETGKVIVEGSDEVVKYTYDQDGALARKRVYTVPGQAFPYVEYTYDLVDNDDDGVGRLIREKRVAGGHSQAVRTFDYEYYGTSDQVSIKTETFNMGVGRNIYEYFEGTGNLKKETEVWAGYTLSERTYEEYVNAAGDTASRLTEEIKGNHTGQTSREVYRDFYDGTDQYQFKDIYDAGNNLVATYEYDSSGNFIEEGDGANYSWVFDLPAVPFRTTVAGYSNMRVPVQRGGPRKIGYPRTELIIQPWPGDMFYRASYMYVEYNEAGEVVRIVVGGDNPYVPFSTGQPVTRTTHVPIEISPPGSVGGYHPGFSESGFGNEILGSKRMVSLAWRRAISHDQARESSISLEDLNKLMDAAIFPAEMDIDDTGRIVVTVLLPDKEGKYVTEGTLVFRVLVDEEDNVTVVLEEVEGKSIKELRVEDVDALLFDQIERILEKWRGETGKEQTSEEEPLSGQVEEALRKRYGDEDMVSLAQILFALSGILEREALKEKLGRAGELGGTYLAEKDREFVHRFAREGGEPVRFDCPLDIIERYDEGTRNQIFGFLKWLAEIRHVYVSFTRNGDTAGEADYKKHGLTSMYVKLSDEACPSGDLLNKRNSVTLFASESLTDRLKKGEVIDLKSVSLELSAGRIPLVQRSIVVPIGSSEDPSGFLRAALMGMRLNHVSRKAKDAPYEQQSDAMKTHIYETVLEYEAGLRDFRRRSGLPEPKQGGNMNGQEVLNLARSTDLNEVSRPFHKLVVTLPIGPVDIELLRKMYEHGLTILQAA
ncbi:MAG: hypothetical protein WCV56_07815, partial [Candidatus Omnitrophota bacterium]